MGALYPDATQERLEIVLRWTLLTFIVCMLLISGRLPAIDDYFPLFSERTV